jgi:hypothetical protein
VSGLQLYQVTKRKTSILHVMQLLENNQSSHLTRVSFNISHACQYVRIPTTGVHGPKTFVEALSTFESHSNLCNSHMTNFKIQKLQL